MPRKIYLPLKITCQLVLNRIFNYRLTEYLLMIFLKRIQFVILMTVLSTIKCLLLHVIISIIIIEISCNPSQWGTFSSQLLNVGHNYTTNLDLIEAYINENRWSYDHMFNKNKMFFYEGKRRQKSPKINTTNVY